jgi:hypothetical protein
MDQEQRSEMGLRSIPPLTSTGTRRKIASPPWTRSGLIFGTALRNLNASLPPNRFDGNRHVYVKPSVAKNQEKVIPARAAAVAKDSIIDDGKKYVVRIDFPVPLKEDELTWEVTGDVLEIECNSTRCVYYRNFLVPNGALFEAERTPTSLLIRFDRGQKSPQEKKISLPKKGKRYGKRR